MREVVRGTREGPLAPARAAHRAAGRPSGPAVRLLDLQRLAGSAAVTSMFVQRQDDEELTPADLGVDPSMSVDSAEPVAAAGPASSEPTRRGDGAGAPAAPSRPVGPAGARRTRRPARRPRLARTTGTRRPSLCARTTVRPLTARTTSSSWPRPTRCWRPGGRPAQGRTGRSSTRCGRTTWAWRTAPADGPRRGRTSTRSPVSPARAVPNRRTSSRRTAIARSTGRGRAPASVRRPTSARWRTPRKRGRGPTERDSRSSSPARTSWSGSSCPVPGVL